MTKPAKPADYKIPETPTPHVRLAFTNRLISGFTEYIKNFAGNETSPEIKRRVTLLVIVSLIGIINLIPFGMLAYSQKNLPLAIFDWTAALLLFLNLVDAKKRKKYLFNVQVGMFCTAGLYIFLYMSGGVNNSAYVWYFTFPLIASFLLGSTQGGIATLLMTLPIFTMMFFDLPSPFFTDYPLNLQIRVLFSYLVIGSLAYLFESTQEKNRRELWLINEQLEMKVQERTRNLERINQQLQREINEKKRAEQINQTLFRISNAVSTSKDLSELYSSIHQALNEITDLTNFYIALYHKEKEKRAFAYFNDEYDDEEKFKDTFTLKDSLTGEVILSGKPLFINQTGLEEREENNKIIGTTPKVWLGVPLKIKEEVIGVMATQSYDDPDHFDQMDLEILNSVSDQVALAIERKRSQQQLKESEEKYRGILKNIEDGYYEVDLAGNFTLVNRAMSKILGYTESELIGMNNRDYMDAENARNAFKTFNTVYRTGATAKTLVLELIRKDNTIRYAEALISMLRDNGDQPVGFRGIVRDITGRIISEEERNALEEQLQQSQKLESLGTLAGGVAHDFNNMMGVIIGHAELAMIQAPADLTVRKDLKKIMKAAHRSADLTRQLLAFARKQTASPKVLDLNDTIIGTIKMMRRLIGEDIDLDWTPNMNLWHIKIDPVQIDQILTNLCVNARDAIDGVGKITITTENVTYDKDDCNGKCKDINGCTPGGYVTLTVSDDGSGMEKEIIKNLFEPFFTTKEVGEGTGLGLATVYGIVKQNDGFIDVKSKPGQGTTFKLFFPRSDGIPEKESTPVSEVIANGNETVLLVEDEEQILKLSREVLMQFGYTVLSTHSPGEAIVTAQQYKGPIHILVTDVVMPEMNGKELLAEINKHRPQIKVLFISGYAADIIMHKGILEDKVQLLQKPFRVSALTGKVREVLDQ